MRTACLRLVIAFLLVFGLNQDSKATHYMGADLSFGCILVDSTSTPPRAFYSIELRIFRDCRGVAVGDSYSFTYKSDCIPDGSITVNAVGGTATPIEITPLCDDAVSPCSSTSPDVSYGVEMYVYRDTLSFPLDSCCEVTFESQSFSARNSAITTLSPAGNMYVEGMMKLGTEPCNNSPLFLEFPTPFTCVGQKTLYNHGVFDPDGDSLAFSLTDCRSASGTKVSYVTGLSGTTPLFVSDTFTIDSVTGNICFTPDRTQVGVICVLVEEFRDGVKVGEVVRDMQYTVLDCPNQLPTQTGIDSTPETILGVCPGQPIDFYIYSDDKDSLDTIFMSWDMGIPGATFTITGDGSRGDRPIGRFQWTPTVADLGSHSFLVTVEDDACPIIGGSNQGFLIEVRNPILRYEDTSLCEGDSILLRPFTSISFTEEDWFVYNGIGDTSILNPWAKPAVTTTYIVEASTGYCSDRDTFTIVVEPTPVVNAGPRVVEICDGDSYDLVGNSNIAGTGLSWNDSALIGASQTVSPTSTTDYVLYGVTPAGCIAYDTITVTVNPLPVVDITGDFDLCLGESTTLFGNIGTGTSHTWSPNIGSGLSPVVTPEVTTTYTLSTTDANGCENSQTITVVVNENPNPDIADTIMYLGEQIRYQADGAPCTPATYEWLDKFGTPISGGSVEDGFDWNCNYCYDPLFDPAGTFDPEGGDSLYTFFLRIEDCNGCTRTDTFSILVKPKALVDIPNAFSPNGDGKNDFFDIIIRGAGVIDDFKLFNRWGEMVYDYRTDGSGGWDGTYRGKEQEIGTYVYYFYYRETPANSEPVKFRSGNVTLLR